jgi:integrase
MPKLTRKLPSYRLHKASGQAVITLNGRDMYLGLHGSAESKAQYDRIVAEWLANHRQHMVNSMLGVMSENAVSDLSVNELFATYWRFATSYYVKNGQPTGEVENIRDAARPLTLLYGQCMASKFGPLALETVRQAMIAQGLCRKVINARVNRIRRMFKWGVSKQMLPPLVLQSLQALAPLKRGRCNVREAAPVKPVAEEHVEAILPHVSQQVAAMIRLQLLTGMRPGEVVIMRGCDLDTTNNIWRYTPESHKTEHHNRERLIYLGPKAQQVLRPWLKPNPQAYLFSPLDAMESFCQQRHSKRRTPLSCGNRPGTNRQHHPQWLPRAHYTTNTYAQAIAKACKKAFPPPEVLRRRKVTGKKGRRWETLVAWHTRLGEEQWREVLAWRKVHHWSPNQLRHSAATYLRKQFGIEAARVILGHSSAAVTEIYAELDFAKAADIMARVG